MADTYTSHLNLVKQDPNARPDIDKEHSNLDSLDSEVWARGKSFNGETVGVDGGFHVRSIPYAENLDTSFSQNSEDDYVIRTTGGDASLSDGDAWLILLRGNRTHTGYTAQSVDMTVTPMERSADPAITATLDEETFESYVGEAGTYTISYTTEWSTSPTLYGLTVSNTPIDGDSITMVWDGENNATVTVNAATRPTPESISATIDEDTFIAYVSYASGTITLTYSTAWSAEPSNYGITVTGTPVAGDVITVVYQKEVRGTITQSDPQTFVSTGWNLYNNSLGYARVIKYSTEYAFKISGTYTALEFSSTVSGSRVTITPVSGAFSIPSDGYVFVTGGNATDTQIWMTWSDWTSSANGGTFAAYSQDVVDISTFMASNFPYGLMQVGTLHDEINLNTGIATSYVVRQAYNATNLANAKASGKQYEYDENYIYIERDTPVISDISVDGGYTAYDHGLEYFTGTDVQVYAETIYGANLKNRLERDVLTISQQDLTTAQKDQVCSNLGISRTTLREVPFAVAVADWSGSGSSFSANFVSAYITTTAKWIMTYDSNIASYAKAHLNVTTKSGGGGLTFSTSKKPTGTITGTVLVFDDNDGKLPVLIEDTVVPLANGGTGQSSLAGAKSALGIQALSENLGNKANLFQTTITVPKNNGTASVAYSTLSIRDGRVYLVTAMSSTNNSWRYVGILYRQSTRTFISQIDTTGSSQLTASADNSQITFTNINPSYDAAIIVQVIGD